MTGYRKRTVEFSAEASGVMQKSPGSLSSDSGLPAYFPKASNGINFMAGTTEHTGNDLNIAIQGNGFFEVQGPDGGKTYTRNGQFHARSDRTLVDGSGNTVMSDSGSPIVFSLNGGKVTINPDGNVVQGNNSTGGAVSIGRIGVFTFAHPENLNPTSGGMFTTDVSNPPQPMEKPNLLQGYTETSNVTPMREMVDMVVISRAYEANQKVIRSVDELGQKAVDDLGVA
jgi:flagellar basal body rod protein FlgG